ncbi:MAG: glycine--tRNA ligase subunit beta [Mariprofundaceae bacterium]
MSQAPLLIEIGVEEIPAGVAPKMGNELFSKLTVLLNNGGFSPQGMRLGITPRRLLIHATSCNDKQADYKEEVWGPPEKVAFDTDGNPTRAAQGFAKKSGLAVSDFSLEDKGDGKARYMKAVIDKKGLAAIDVLAQELPAMLRKLASPKQMQWQDGLTRSDAFIRPVRWIVARLGDAVIPFEFAGIQSGKASYAHRMAADAKGEISVGQPFEWLEQRMVIADREARKNSIIAGLNAAALAANVKLVSDTDLVEEVTDLTEWPHVITGHYLEEFLCLPIEVSRIELKHHQRCFSTEDAAGKTSNVFFAVANIKSKNPALVAHGNERVVNARLADAMFFFVRDPKETLEQRVEKLSEIIFQDGLGMVGDQVRRIRGFVLDNAEKLGVDTNDGQRAAYLCKSDLTTGLVGEFPELQGYMGGIYADMDGENSTVSSAIAEHYAPAGADDALPKQAAACAIGLVERADKLLGYFHLGKIPTASADPFALRRAAISFVRLAANENNPIQMNLSQILSEASKQWNQQRVTVTIDDNTQNAVKAFIHERLLGLAESFGTSRSALEAALGAANELPLYQHIKVAKLLTGFADSEDGQAVAAANKRIANILKKSDLICEQVQTSLFEKPAETELFEKLTLVSASFPESPAQQLEALASLREAVDQFFDDVMVMADDEAIKNNRLALLNQLRTLFLQLADVSKL